MLADDTTQSQTAIFRISPLISGSLTGLLLVLLAPLPLLMLQQHQENLLPFAAVGTTFGALLFSGLISQRVSIDAQGVRVEYASWVPQWLVQGWSLGWEEVESLKSRPTSQSGQTHYFITRSGQAYLLPMRIAGFAQFLRLVEAYSRLDTSKIKPLAQPWMYFMLGILVILMGLIDLPVMLAALSNLH
jgi:hypothetical protein